MPKLKNSNATFLVENHQKKEENETFLLISKHYENWIYEIFCTHKIPDWIARKWWTEQYSESF